MDGDRRCGVAPVPSPDRGEVLLRRVLAGSGVDPAAELDRARVGAFGADPAGPLRHVVTMPARPGTPARSRSCARGAVRS